MSAELRDEYEGVGYMWFAKCDDCEWWADVWQFRLQGTVRVIHGTRDNRGVLRDSDGAMVPDFERRLYGDPRFANHSVMFDGSPNQFDVTIGGRPMK